MCAANALPLRCANVSLNDSFLPLSVPVNVPAAAAGTPLGFGTSRPATSFADSLYVPSLRTAARPPAASAAVNARTASVTNAFFNLSSCRPCGGHRWLTRSIRRGRAFGFQRGRLTADTAPSSRHHGGSAPRGEDTADSRNPARDLADVRYTSARNMAKPVQELDRVIIRFAGDSGDGMQLTGGRFTSETAVLGNDLSTLPDFPAEIRAPAGSLPGVSGFQVHFADHDILTPGDAPNVLVAMNPAALKTNIRDLPKGGTLIVNSDSFTARNLEKAGYETNPLEDGSLDEFQAHSVQLTSMTLEALKDVDVTKREAERAKNMFALGLMSWLYNRPTEGTVEFIERKFASKPSIAEANRRAFQAGYAFGETTESFAVSYEVKPAKLRPGVYRNVTGNQALSLGLVAASVQSKLPLFLGAYPITPASGILEELARFKNFGVRTFQAEDEIAAVGAALGASFGGSLGVSTSSGPGVVLKGETIGLAVALELPLVILDIQRAGPSTGMPTKPEQADLLLALYGRNAESPVPVVAASTPGNCFDAALEAVRIATKYRTPVFLLSDAYLANGSEPLRATFPTSRSTTRRARACSCSAGAVRPGRSAPRCGVCARAAGRSPRRTCIT